MQARSATASHSQPPAGHSQPQSLPLSSLQLNANETHGPHLAAQHGGRRQREGAVDLQEDPAGGGGVMADESAEGEATDGIFCRRGRIQYYRPGEGGAVPAAHAASSAVAEGRQLVSRSGFLSTAGARETAVLASAGAFKSSDTLHAQVATLLSSCARRTPAAHQGAGAGRRPAAATRRPPLTSRCRWFLSLLACFHTLFHTLFHFGGCFNPQRAAAGARCAPLILQTEIGRWQSDRTAHRGEVMAYICDPCG